jgi:hypothetical protein
MKNTFTLIKPGGNLELHYCKGSQRGEKGRTTYTVESPDHIFKFVLLDVEKGGQVMGAKGVKALHPTYVIFENGFKVEYPAFRLCETELLPDSERTARWMAIQAKSSEAEHKKQIEQIQYLNDEIASIKRGRVKTKKNSRVTESNPKGAGKQRKCPDLDGFMLRAWNQYQYDTEIQVKGQRSRVDFFERKYWTQVKGFKDNEANLKKHILNKTRMLDKMAAVKQSIWREKNYIKSKKD